MTLPAAARRPYPLFLRFDNRLVLLVGGGDVAREKAEALHAAGARLRVVAPYVHPGLLPLAATFERRPFAPGDVDGAWLVVAAATPAVNRAVKLAADARRVFVIAVDDVASCSAIGAAQLHRGGLSVAISSDGRAPALVALLCRALEELLPDDAAAWVTLAEEARARWKANAVPLAERRPLLLRVLNAMYARAEVTH